MAKAKAARRLIRRSQRALQAEQQAFHYSRAIVPNTVLYQAFFGRGVLCNPEAIFRHLLDRPGMEHLQHIWVLDGLDSHADVIAEFAERSNVQFVEIRSADYRRVLATSQYLINNATFPPEFYKREGQTYVNTWHGTPLKAMGYDMPGGARASTNVLRNFVSADYLLSSGPFMTERMYETAYRLRGIYTGTVVETGYPRIDRQFIEPGDRESILERLRGLGLDVGSKRIVLYAPTWQGTSYNSPKAQLGRLRRLLDDLRASEAGADADILLKVHEVVYDQAASDPLMAPYLVPNEVITNELLAVTDTLITDYSSIYIDFLPLNRPVVFYVPDLETYGADRGFFFKPESWPGPVVQSTAELIHALSTYQSIDSDEQLWKRHSEARELLCPLEDGDATRRVVDLIFTGASNSEHTRRLDETDKETMLIYLGGMLRNGITTSALGLLDNIDYDRYDVTAFYQQTNVRDRVSLIRQINPAVRHLARAGGIGGSKLHRFGRQRLLREGDSALVPFRDQIDRMFRDEWQRCFGDAQFDHVVDFSGYGPFWAHILLQAKRGTLSVWLHNDLSLDAMREIDGNRPREKDLTSMFSLYRRFDTLVSVSESLSEVNADKLSRFADRSKFTSARNTINAERVLLSAHGEPPEVHDDHDGEVVSFEPTEASLEPSSFIAKAMSRFGVPWFDAEVRRLKLLTRWFPDDRPATTFVAVGRLSPEKNYERLIRAFSIVHEHDPDTRLLIVGRGPLRRELTEVVDDLALEGSVFFTGQLSNPYVIVGNSDCLVLSSNYEGQPMVILEAKVLGVPVVTTRFESVASALDPDEGLIVDQTVEGVAEGMMAFLRGEVVAKPFDPAAYNASAMEEFYAAIGSATSG